MYKENLSQQRKARVLVGMVHLGRMLTAEGMGALDQVESRAVGDALALANAGFDAVLLENFGDTPFHPDHVQPHIIAGMTRMALAVRRSLDGCDKVEVQMGVQVLRNDALAALGVAAAVRASFIRVNVHSGAMVTDQGIIGGRAFETCPYRDLVAPECALWADVRVKHASPLGERAIEAEASDLVRRGRADVVVVTGQRTGGEIDIEELARLHEALPDAAIMAGSGVSLHNYATVLPHVHGVIVGTSIKEEGEVERPVDRDRAYTLVQGIRRWEKNHS